jgi:hypothetical protein
MLYLAKRRPANPHFSQMWAKALQSATSEFALAMKRDAKYDEQMQSILLTSMRNAG